MQLAEEQEPLAVTSPLRVRLSAWLRRPRGPRAPREPQWAATLGQVISVLEGMNGSTEQHFLQIGGKLVEFMETVDSISAELTGLASFISGEQGQRSSDALTCALDSSIEMSARYTDRKVGLETIRQDAGRLKRALSGFQEIVSTFHTLGVLTRVETARLGSEGTDFGSLADDVRLLAGNIEERVESARDATARLIPPIESAMQSISALEESQAKDLPSVISNLRASLASFRDTQSKVQRSSARLGARYDAISDTFKKLIVSLQFHDITRQQLEHVIGVLQRLRDEMEGRGGSSSRGRTNVGAVLALQLSQLTDAGEKFASSVASVTCTLGDIAAHVREMTDESRTLTGLSGDDKTSFFVQMEQGCATILASLNQCAAAEAASMATSCGMAETIGQMRGSIEEIRAIETQMQRMALNGSIRAAHLGVAGDALAVLAGSMQQLAMESRSLAGALIEALGSMNAATRLTGQVSGPPGEVGSQHRSLDGVQAAVADFHMSSERSFSLITQIVARGTRLSEDLSATRSSFSVGVLFAEALGRARAMLAELVEVAEPDSPPDSAEELKTGLADFSAHYTMQAERDIHEGITKEPPASLESGETGENVEFF